MRHSHTRGQFREKSYDIVRELNRLGLLSAKRARLISEYIELSINEKYVKRYDDKLELISYMTPGLQVKALDKFFGHLPITTNSFFEGMETSAIHNLLEGFDVANFVAGEVIYNFGQPAQAGRIRLTQSTWFSPEESVAKSGRLVSKPTPKPLSSATSSCSKSARDCLESRLRKSVPCS